MKIQRRHKRYGSVLGLALVALAFDRFILGPDEAAAVDVPSAAVTDVSSSVPGVPALPSAGHSGSLEAAMAKRLEKIAHEQAVSYETMPDAFQLPAAWVGEEPTIAVTSEATGFRDSHQLQAAMANGAESVAIIDGRTVRLGQMLDGMRLTEVRSRSVEFTSDDGVRVELPLEQRAPGAE